MCLHLVRSLFGVGAELVVGRELAAGPARHGQQPQYVDVLSPPGADLADVTDPAGPEHLRELS
ncbi:hypothetical protein GCM10027063_48740 [Promicromonospora xylanilytica]